MPLFPIIMLLHIHTVNFTVTQEALSEPALHESHRSISEPQKYHLLRCHHLQGRVMGCVTGEKGWRQARVPCTQVICAVHPSRSLHTAVYEVYFIAG